MPIGFQNFNPIHDKSKPHLETCFANIDKYQFMIVMITVSIQDGVSRLYVVGFRDRGPEGTFNSNGRCSSFFDFNFIPFSF